ncbi:hypothetical protein [Croceivirga sp. JEA036]|uniref:hypothetical protein n=1 Tax=Croceivirga sp. JEA036 TaxID=2721162 RepID=UPI00143916C1|nr:hypothetical protein [Croceivirga sp. JEA036]NJB37052.1 hypothetical protein [Croceivirga sp. JEA036]
MSGFDTILVNLELFIKKYYAGRLLRGVLLLLSFGGLFFLVIGSVEFLFWFNSAIRMFLLALLTIGLLGLLYYFIIVPILYLFKFKSGLTYKDAATVIGRHFPEIDDKLKNLLELAEDSKSNDLVLAAIEQKSDSLGIFTFSSAIDLKANFKYTKYLIMPMFILLVYLVSGNLTDFFSSYSRVSNYDIAYEKPAPFTFQLSSTDLSALQFSNKKIKVTTVGNIRPNKVFISVDGVERQLIYRDGFYEYEFVNLMDDVAFNFKSDEISSRTYVLKVVKVPAISDFKLELDYPKYVNFKKSKINATGSVTVPEGTRVGWNIKGYNLDNVNILLGDSTFTFKRKNSEFLFEEKLYDDVDYEIITSNKDLAEFERLSYKIAVIKDEYPKLKMEVLKDTLAQNSVFYMGNATDDYGLTKVLVQYKEIGSNNGFKSLELEKPNRNVHQFFYQFPTGLDIVQGKEYEYFFQLFDNDKVNGSKSIKSDIYSTKLLTNSEIDKISLENQSKLINQLEDRLLDVKDLEISRKDLDNTLKTNQDLDYSEQQQLRQFVQNQKKQEELLEKFSKGLKENLQKSKENEEFSKLLQERLERQELEARKNKRLMEELNKLADKINKEELQFKLDELSKSQSTNKRNLKQLVELTKKYYVTEKVAELSRALEKLSERQLKLSNLSIEDRFAIESQEKINSTYKRIRKELEEVQKDNLELKKPIAIDVEKDELDKIEKTQSEALEEVQKHQGSENTESESGKSEESNAKQKQRASGEQLKKLSEQLNSGSMSGGGSSVAEDAEMLRQILDNLIIFSFKQENLMERMQGQNLELSQFSSSIKEQKELKNLFGHIDDSLFALSLRQVELAEFMNEQIEEVYYNSDKALASIADNKLYQGLSYQQYVLTASNNLADYLANVMDNMQKSMQSGNGQGQGNDAQLPDIIRGQQSVDKKMSQSGSGKEGVKKGDSDGEGSKGEKGEKGGESGKGKGKQRGDSDGNGEAGKGGKNGKENATESGTKTGYGMTESELQEVYEIYKQQQLIRSRLEDQLADLVRKEDRDLARKLVQQMKNFEDELLENGITQKTRNRASNIQQQLLKLKNAELEQGRKKERESKSGVQSFKNDLATPNEDVKKRFNQIEILNKQALPLRQNYHSKVKEYFKKDD